MVLAGLRGAGIVGDRVVAVCDADGERARLLAAAQERPPTGTGGRRPTGAGVLATTDPCRAMDEADTVWICTPTSSHVELVEEAAARGLAVYCEKPLAPDMAGAERLAGAAGSLMVQVGLVLRHSPVLDALVGQLRSGTLGPLMALLLRDDQYFPVQGQYRSSWRADRSVCGGGTLIEHSVHDLDALAWLAGPVRSLSARTANWAGHPGVEDVAALTLAHAGGATSTLLSVWHQVLSRPSTRRFEAVCQHGVLWCDDEHRGPLWLQTDQGVSEIDLGHPPERPERAVARYHGLSEEVGDALVLYVRSDLGFLRALASGTAPQPGLADALEAHRLVDAAYRDASELRGEVVADRGVPPGSVRPAQ
jgi:predicted dehydrogenase